MTQYSLGDRVLVRLVGSRAERPADVIDDRGDRVRVQYDAADGDFREKEIVRKDRVRIAPKPFAEFGAEPRVAPIIPPPIAAAARVEIADMASESLTPAEYIGAVEGRPEAFAKAVLHAVPKGPKPWRSEAYMAWVRKRQCLAASYASKECVGRREAHHHGGPKGMGVKAPDSYCISLCLGHHTEYHNTGGIDGMPTLDATAAGAQAGQLMSWCSRQGIDTDNVIIEALTAALRKED